MPSGRATQCTSTQSTRLSAVMVCLPHKHAFFIERWRDSRRMELARGPTATQGQRWRELVLYMAAAICSRLRCARHDPGSSQPLRAPLTEAWVLWRLSREGLWPILKDFLLQIAERPLLPVKKGFGGRFGTDRRGTLGLALSSLAACEKSRWSRTVRAGDGHAYDRFVRRVRRRNQ
jgi:hypothetical protein